MKRLLALALGFTIVVSIVLAQKPSDGQNSNENPHSASSENRHEAMHHGPAMKVEFENDAVQVFRVRIGPHERIPMHDIATPRVQILLTDEHLRITLPNGETREENHKAGETSWLERQRHAGENLSDTPLEFVTVVPKGR